MAFIWQPIVPRVPQEALNARQRKQVYMSSNVFEAGSPSQTNMYHPTSQRQALAKVQQQMCHRPQTQAYVFPNHRDIKVTTLYGYNALPFGSATPVPQGSLAVATTPVVRFGDRSPPIQVVIANREEGGLPREYWGSTSNLAWTDLRGERLRKQEVKEAGMRMDASQRKLQDLSSEVFGSNRMTQKSTTSAAQEIKAAPLLDHCSEAALKDRRARGNRQATTLNASEQKLESLAASVGSQFSRCEENVKPRSASADARQAVMFQGKGVMIGSEDRINDHRRRSERNYSDLFGTGSARPLSLGEAGRSELHAAATASWLDATTETSARNLERRNGSREGNLVYDAHAKSVESIALPLSPRSSARQVDLMQEERACWDLSPKVGSMASAVEVARRQREPRRPRSYDAGNFRALSASERKHANLASGQLRCATGAKPLPHDDGRQSPLARGSRRGVVDSPAFSARCGEESPAARAALERAAPNSARQRRLKEMLTSVGFF